MAVIQGGDGFLKEGKEKDMRGSLARGRARERREGEGGFLQ